MKKVPKTEIVNGKEITCGCKYVVGETRTACSVRTIPLLDEVADALKLWRDYLKNNGVFSEDFVIVNTDGGSYHYQTLQNNYKKFIRGNGIDFSATFTI